MNNVKRERKINIKKIKGKIQRKMKKWKKNKGECNKKN